MRAAIVWVLSASALVGCHALDVPGPPGAGSLQGVVVFTSPGREKAPAGGATVELLGTSLTTKADPTSGFFSLSPVPASTGTLLFRFDADGDGTPEHNRAIKLEAVKAGPGRTTALGEVLLSGIASVRGVVLRADTLASPTGHGGSTAFTPAGPYLVFTGDNGAFAMDGLPEGDVTLAFFHDGFRSQQTTIDLRAGETFSLPTIVLTAENATASDVRVTGSATLLGQSSFGGTTVSCSNGAKVNTAADGMWSMEVPRGLYAFGFQHEGFGTVTLRNIVATGADFQAPPVVMVPGSSTPPDLDGGSRYDAGVGVDAGRDAGSDAGLDAGSDAGLDAGSDAGLDAGSDAGLDAGSDAGAVPVAVIDPLPLFRVPGALVTLAGTNSLGARPFTYHWRQTRPFAPIVALSSNHLTTSATPSFSSPDANVFGFTLAVTDAFGRTSAESSEATIAVGNPPTATIRPPTLTTLYAGQVITLDGSPSVDPNGTGLVQYVWSVAPAGLILTQQSGPTLRLTMPATVVTPVVVQVSLQVINGLGIASQVPATVSFMLTNAAVPGWYVDAGAGQTVSGNSIVTLNGLAFTPGLAVPDGGVRYLWSPAADPDGGWALTDPNQPITTFVTPNIVGMNQLINFTLTATVNGFGVNPPTASATTFVNMLDRVPPSVIATSINTGRLGSIGATIDFSEPIDPQQIAGISMGSRYIERVLRGPGDLSTHRRVLVHAADQRRA